MILRATISPSIHIIESTSHHILTMGKPPVPTSHPLDKQYLTLGLSTKSNLYCILHSPTILHSTMEDHFYFTPLHHTKPLDLGF